MKTTLLVENNTALESFYTLNLQTWVGTNVMAKKEAKFALSLLTDDCDIDLVICKARCGLERTAEALREHLKGLNKNIPLLIIGKSNVPEEEATYLSNGLEIKSLIQACAKNLRVTAKDMAQMEVPEYFPININYFMPLKHTVTEIYEECIDSPGSYSLKINAEDTFDPQIIKSYIAEGVVNLFVKKNDRLKFVTNITSELIVTLDNKELNTDEQISAQELGQKLLQQKLAYIGITDETVKLAQKQMKSIIGSAKKAKSLNKLLARMMKNKAGYQFKHTQILTFVCTHLMEHIDWGNDDQKAKIAFIAFFHDIVLQNDKQAQIHSTHELKTSDLSPTEKKLVESHAQKAAELILKYPSAPMGADIIIRQHHGVAHGIGFSDTYSGNLSPMTIVFILAEDFTDDLIHGGKDFNFSNKIALMRKRYSTQRFQKIIDILEKISL